MRTINDHPGFQEAQNTLESVVARIATLDTERADILRQLTNGMTVSAATTSAVDRAQAMLSGTAIPSPSDAYNATREHELSLRGQLERLHQVVRDLPRSVEHQRDLARSERIRELADQFADVRATWDKAVALLRQAVGREDELLSQVVAEGFGRQDPLITAPNWLVRDLFVMNASVPKANGSKH